MNKTLKTFLFLLILTFLSSCNKPDKEIVMNGLNRKVVVYSLSGDLINTYYGKTIIEEHTNTVVTLNINGKRFIFHNCTVIMEEE
jgi:lipoprotein